MAGLVPGHARLLSTEKTWMPATSAGMADKRACRSGQGDKIVFADALQDEKHSRRVTGVGNKVRALRGHRIGLSRGEPYFFFWILEEDPNGSRHDVKRVVDVVMIVPGHLLRGADLKLGDAKPRTHRVVGATLHLVEPARIRHCLHGASSALFDSLDVRVANDLGPPCHFRFDLGLEFFGGADGDGKADCSQAFFHLGPGKNFIDFAIELIDDFLWRSSRSDDALEE